MEWLAAPLWLIACFLTSVLEAVIKQWQVLPTANQETPSSRLSCKTTVFLSFQPGGEELGRGQLPTAPRTHCSAQDDSLPSSFRPTPSGRSLLSRVPDSTALTTPDPVAILNLAT